MSAVKHGAYSLGGQLFQLLINLAGLILLARLLTPEIFGVFAIILAFQALFVPLLDLGLTDAYIKAKEDGADLRNAFFTLNLLIGAVNFLYLLAVTPLLISGYHINDALIYITVIGLSVMLGACNNQPMARMRRQFEFPEVVRMQMLSNLVALIFSLVLAYAGAGIWALISRMAMSPAISFLLLLSGGRASYRLAGIETISRVRGELKFAGELVFSRILTGWLNTLDVLLFSTVYNKQLLGFYTKAKELAAMPDLNIRQAITFTAFSYFSRQEDSDKERNYRLTINVTLLLVAIPCVLIISTGRELMPFVLGEQWQGAGVYFQIMGVWAIGRVMYGIGAVIHQSEKKMWQWMRLNLVALPTLFGGLLLLLAADKNPVHGIIAYSLGYTAFWGGGVVLALVKLCGWKLARQIFRALLSYILVPAIASVWGLSLLEIQSLFVSIPMTILIITVSVIILNFSQTRELLSYAGKGGQVSWQGEGR